MPGHVLTTSNIPAYRFKSEQLTETALQLLATPEYVNGVFDSAAVSAIDQSPQVRVFAATWPATRTLGLNVIQHTPDICWVGAGWLPIDLGQPDQLVIAIPCGSKSDPLNTTASLRFECRAFRSPDGSSRELVIWCTIVGGQVLPESSRFRSSKLTASRKADIPQERQYAAGRRLSADYFVQSLQKRLKVRGAKQFVRLSTAADSDYRRSVVTLTAFAEKWLSFGP